MKLILSFFFIASALAEISVNPFSDDFINDINKRNLTWKAGRYFDESMTLAQVRKLLGVLSSDTKFKALSVRYHNSDDTEIPATFDARDKWSNCSSIKMVRDQANCGSCWAFAAVEAMSDRICIHSNEKNQTLVSAEDLLSCCGTKCGDGCDGGYPAAAWEYWYTTGLVSGGLNGDTKECKAYSLKPCNHHVEVEGGANCSEIENAATPKCLEKCDDAKLDYKSQKTFGSKPYAISSIEKDIQIEILTNGPVEASFDVFPSFVVYREGVYQKDENEKSIGGHAVKIIGWGLEKNTKYWLIVNSWNENWGEKGLFKMLRGENHCGIESNIVAGLPLKSSGITVFPEIGVITLLFVLFSHLL